MYMTLGGNLLCRLYVLFLFVVYITVTISESTSNREYLTCLYSNAPSSLRLAREIQACLAEPVNAIYLNVHPSPNSSDSFLWSFSFTSYFVVVDATASYVDLLSFYTLSLNLCYLRVEFQEYCDPSFYGLDSSDERTLIGTFLYNKYFISADNSIGVISNAEYSEMQAMEDKEKVITVSQTAFLCQFATDVESHLLYLSNSFCCRHNLSATRFSIGNQTIYPLACPLENETLKKPYVYFATVMVLSGILTVVLLLSNIEYFVPVLYTWSDPVFIADTNVPIFWGKPGQKYEPNYRRIYGGRYFCKFIIASFPVIWGTISQYLVDAKGYLFPLIIIVIVADIWVLIVCLDPEVQTFILKNIPQPLYAFVLLKKRFSVSENNTKYRRTTLRLLYLVPTICTIAFIYSFVIWCTIILFFVVCGMAANTSEAISTIILIVALGIVIKTEYTILKRPILRVKVLLMNQEDLQELTWGQVYTLLDKLHWLPRDVLRRRLPIYFALGSMLGLIYFAIRIFSDGKSALMSNVIFQSVIMLVVGYIPSLLDSENFEESAMLEMYKEIGLRELGDELKLVKTRGKTYCTVGEQSQLLTYQNK